MDNNNLKNIFSDDTEAERKFETYHSRDPFPEIPPSLLNSADIEDYVRETGMISPFYRERLKSASYEARFIGEVTFFDGGHKKQKKINEGCTFILKKNSIVFVSIEPTIRLPDYIALRFNLRIKLVHRGLLLGTGPLIDPGFVGKIMIPLHNLTNNDYELIGGEGLIWIEFTKLSPNDRWNNPKQSCMRKGKYKEFPKNKNLVDHVEYISKALNYQRATTIFSSLTEVRDNAQNAVDKSGESVRRVDKFEKLIKKISIAAVIATAIMFGGFIYGGYQLITETLSFADGVQKNLNVINREIREIDKRIEGLPNAENYKWLHSKLLFLEKKLKTFNKLQEK